MSLQVHLLGPPRIEAPGPDPYRLRSRKSWALLACLILGERPWSRSQLTALLFADADDPLRALRWSLAEIRRALGDGALLTGDPVVLRLPSGTVVDATVVTNGTWAEAVRLPGLGAELLEGPGVRGAPVFESWLLSERRRLAAASEAILHEAALGSMSRGRVDDAIAYAVRAVGLNPLDENNHALLVRLYRLAGDGAAARRQHDACAALFEAELGIRPGDAVAEALREPLGGSRRTTSAGASGAAAIEAVIEAGVAAVAAGAAQAGIDSLRSAVRLADLAEMTPLRVAARLSLAEALIHALGGLDESGLAALHEADGIALETGDRAGVAQARAELGYVDFLRGRYARAEHWLQESLRFCDGDTATRAKATTYLGAAASDRADYPSALTHLQVGHELGGRSERSRVQAYAAAMIGRVHLLRGAWEDAVRWLETSLELATGAHWLAFLPWPQALLGEALNATGAVDEAGSVLAQAFARACQLGDPCWEGMSARGLALVARARGQVDVAFETLVDARARGSRRADGYAWLDVHILDALCSLGVEQGHPGTGAWVAQMVEAAARAEMRELSVRALRHAAALGDEGAAQAAALLAAGIDNPLLHGTDAVGVADPAGARRAGASA